MKIKVIVQKQPGGDYRAEIPAAADYCPPPGAHEITAIVHNEAGGGYWMECAGLPGCATYGRDLAELNINICEAVSGYLSVDDSKLKLHPHTALQVAEAAI